MFSEDLVLQPYFSALLSLDEVGYEAQLLSDVIPRAVRKRAKLVE